MTTICNLYWRTYIYHLHIISNDDISTMKLVAGKSLNKICRQLNY